MQEKQNDHDLLIILHTKFEQFEKTHARFWSELNDKMTRMLHEVEKKAEKEDVKELEKRVIILENYDNEQRVRKQTIINLGEIGVKGWVVISGAVLFFIAVIKEILSV